MRVLVLGGYGVIGSAVARRLMADGHAVAGLGRGIAAAQRQLPGVQWIAADLATLTTEAAWSPLLDAARPAAIVNCAGALQDGTRDDVAAVHLHAMRALYAAALRKGVTSFVQISAVGVREDHPTAFMRTKAEADVVLRLSGLDWTILRPGLVIAHQAYGGTALLRALAAMPAVQPIVHARSRVQTIAVDDVAAAVAAVLSGRVPSRRIYDLVEDCPHTLDGIVRELRGWLGFAPVRTLDVPPVIARLVSLGADALSWLGWRSPFRSTALAVLADGVTGDPRAWREATGASFASLDATLARNPSTVQERWFARAFLLKPAAIGTLALFWIITGIVTLADPARAVEVLTSRGVASMAAGAIAVGGAIVDFALGLAMLWRRTFAHAARGMIAVTLAYLAGGSILAPDLWVDPLGPFVKAVPAMVLALAVLALEDDR